MTAYSLGEWEAMLRAVVAAPDDDLPRLVAADWLEEHEESLRAEFIRVQCELCRGPDRIRRSTLLAREKELLQSPDGACWWAFEACPNIVTIDFGDHGTMSIRDFHRVTFQRGFPHSINTSATDWLRHGSRIVPRQPIQSLTIHQCDDLPQDDWWGMLPSLVGLKSIFLDTRWAQLPRWLRERLPKTDITPYR